MAYLATAHFAVCLVFVWYLRFVCENKIPTLELGTL